MAPKPMTKASECKKVALRLACPCAAGCDLLPDCMFPAFEMFCTMISTRLRLHAALIRLPDSAWIFLIPIYCTTDLYEVNNLTNCDLKLRVASVCIFSAMKLLLQ